MKAIRSTSANEKPSVGEKLDPHLMYIGDVFFLNGRGKEARVVREIDEQPKGA